MTTIGAVSFISKYFYDSHHSLINLLYCPLSMDGLCFQPLE